MISMDGLTKSQRSYLKNISFTKIFAIVIEVAGVLGILFGIFAHFYRYTSPDERQLNISLIVFSICFLCMGYILYHVCDAVDALIKNNQFNEDTWSASRAK